MNCRETLNYDILFVEDEEKIRKNYVQYLKRYFKNVYEAGDGEQGYRVYKDKKPDILIIDINLPIVSGLEMLTKIRKNDHTTKALMLTAHSDKHYLLNASQLKLTQYLLKPITREELKEALNLAVDELKRFKTISNEITNFKNGYSWNHTSGELFVDNKTVSITPSERKVLQLLFSNTNMTFTSEALIADIWDTFEDDKKNALKNILRKLRAKLPEDVLVNVYGEGYKVIV